jgi:undecaprenyl-diphosphatase
MSWIEAIILGVLQGVTEFFPVSSSAHLRLAKILFGIEQEGGQVIFDLTCHLGTLVALLLFYRREVYSLFSSERKKLLLFGIALLPLIPTYLLLKPLRERLSEIGFLGFCLMGTAAILFLGGRWRVKGPKRDSFQDQLRDVLYIGAMQSAALIPGVSRSASTLSAAHVLGWSAKEAVRFSFLLSIPTIIGGHLLELIRLQFSHPLSELPSFSSCLIGFLSSLGVGGVTIRFATRRLEKGDLKPFAWYCLFLGILVTLYFYAGKL